MADFQSMLARMGMCEDMDRLALQSPSAFQTPSPLVRSTTFQSQSGEGSVAVQQQPEVSKLGREVFDAVAEPGSGASPEDQLAKLREQCVGAMGKVKAEAKSEKEREKRENKEKAEAKLEKERGKIEKAEAKSEKEREKREKKEEAESQKEKEKRRKLDQGITATAVKAKVAKPERQTSSSTVLQLKSENASEGGIMQGQGSEVAKESGPKDSEEQKGTIPKGERLVPKDVKENVEPAPTKEVKRKRRQRC
ncbi:unnamed protein product [Durusdinium trenchii]|uniref:Uncharacterized protein n=1 Tax=Durusdinium trenchii TaxID=1381693 RepID=A0ABP0IPR2_9DINO